MIFRTIDNCLEFFIITIGKGAVFYSLLHCIDSWIIMYFVFFFLEWQRRPIPTCATWKQSVYRNEINTSETKIFYTCIQCNSGLSNAMQYMYCNTSYLYVFVIPHTHFNEDKTLCEYANLFVSVHKSLT